MKSVPNREILLNILKCTVAFYSVYYVIAAILFGAFRLHKFDGTMPFDFKLWIDLTKCCISYPLQQIANLMSMLLSYFLSSWCFALLVKDRLWDYAITVTLLHVGLCSLVMLSFPLNWSWWICLGVSLIIMICIGEIVIHFWRRAKEHNAEPKESPRNT